ncbi:MAG: heme ABC exporter ATP-binding protein CcmA [Planctomycetota bacterium]|jgi:heme exporter protein A
MSKRAENSCFDGPVIEITSVTKTFGSRPVLKSIDLQVTSGSGICICGVNGAGKSTLLGIIAGLLKPPQGSVKICGFDLNAEPEKTKSKIGLISHKSILYPELTTSENLLFFARLYGVKNRQKRVEELLEDIGLSSYTYDRTSVLSRGMLQRLSIARAMVHRPAVLLADEPFTGLDMEAGKHLISVLTRFRADGGTLVMTTHDTSMALKCCDRVLVLDGCRFVFDAQASQIDADAFEQDYLLYARRTN